MQDAMTPLLAHPGNVRQLVDQSGGDQQTPRPQDFAVTEYDREPVRRVGDVDHFAREDLAAVREDLVTPPTQPLHGAHAIKCQQLVHPVGRSVPRLARVHHCHRAACPGQRQGSAEAGRAAPHDHRIPDRTVVFCHVWSSPLRATAG